MSANELIDFFTTMQLLYSPWLEDPCCVRSIDRLCLAKELLNIWDALGKFLELANFLELPNMLELLRDFELNPMLLSMFDERITEEDLPINPLPPE